MSLSTDNFSDASGGSQDTVDSSDDEWPTNTSHPSYCTTLLDTMEAKYFDTNLDQETSILNYEAGWKAQIILPINKAPVMLLAKARTILPGQNLSFNLKDNKDLFQGLHKLAKRGLEYDYGLAEGAGCSEVLA